MKELLPTPGAPLPDPNDKPKYTNVIANISQINPEQQMYYLANPENGRKVGGSWEP